MSLQRFAVTGTQRAARLLLLSCLLALAPFAAAQNPCFTDAGAGSTDWNVHYNWAQSRATGQLKFQLSSKIGTLFRCSSVADAALFDSFADISLLVARYVPGAACFHGDAGVVSSDRGLHRGWAERSGRGPAMTNLQSKVQDAMNCLGRPQQVRFYADVSAAIASTGLSPAPVAVPAPAPPPPEKKVEAPPAAASLLLFAQPAGAQVYVDDVFKGVTSDPEGRLKVEGLSPGNHEVRLALPGFKQWRLEVALVAGENKTVESKLEAAGPKPLTLPEIEEALANGVRSARLTVLVKQYGVDFALTAELQQGLRAKGADSDLLLAIATNKK